MVPLLEVDEVRPEIGKHEMPSCIKNLPKDREKVIDQMGLKTVRSKVYGYIKIHRFSSRFSTIEVETVKRRMKFYY